MPLTLHSAVGLVQLASPTDPMIYKISFFLSQMDIKKSSTVLYNELHSNEVKGSQLAYTFKAKMFSQYQLQTKMKFAYVSTRGSSFPQGYNEDN